MLKRRIGVFILSIIMVMTLIGCGTNGKQSNDASAVSENLDLTGLWVQEDKNDSYMTAIIKDNSIGVFFILDGDETPWTYWVGTYIAPDTDKDSYSWTSESTYGGDGLLASQDSTKEFNYKNGKLQYEVTIEGDTKTFSLVKGDWDTTNIPESAFASVNTDNTDVLPIEIKESGWSGPSDGMLNYYVKLYNPNEKIAIDLPSFRVTPKDASGSILGTEEQTCNIVYPKQEFVYSSIISVSDGAVADVDFEMLDTEDYNVKNAEALKAYTPLSATNVSSGSDKITGEITNPNDYDIGDAIVVVLLKDDSGKVVDSQSTFVSNVKSKATTPFSLDLYDDIKYSTYEVYANQWSE